jgi:TonB family protein
MMILAIADLAFVEPVAQIHQDADRPPPIVLVPSPPAPPAPPAYSRRLRPDGDPAAWLTNEDYPAEALRDGAEGAVGVYLRVDAAGAVVACTVTTSSGWKSLDDATCALMGQRARFIPALDLAGRPVAASYSLRYRWAIEGEAEPWMQVPRFREIVALESWSLVRRMTTNADAVVRCISVARSGASGPIQRPCKPDEALDEEFVGELGGWSKKPVDIVFFVQQRVPGSASMPEVALPRGSRIFSKVTISFDVDLNGNRQSCREVDREGAPGWSEGLCQVRHSFLPVAKAGSSRPVRGVTLTVGYYTSAAAGPTVPLIPLPGS